MATVYSHRFLRSSVVKEWRYATVPAGKRAVIRSLTCVNNATTAATVYATAAGTSFYVGDIPGLKSLVPLLTMVVLFEGEQLGILQWGDDMHTTVSGYLLTDTVTAREPRGELVGDPVPEHPALVSGLPGSVPV